MSFEKKTSNLFLGIDGGGSQCRAVIAKTGGQVIGRGRAGLANPLHGFQKSIDAILEATRYALIDAGLDDNSFDQLIAGVGLAGVNLPALYQQVNEWQHPFSQMYLTTDLDIANIGAHDGGDGAVIIVGTGSCGYSSAAGGKIILGGLGFPISDKASGAWMGLEAIKHTLLVLEDFAEKSILAEKTCAQLAVDDALSLSSLIAGSSSKEYAKLASVVFESADLNDKTAKNIIDDGLNYISKMTDKLLVNKPKRLCMIGGLAKFILPRLPAEQYKLFVEPIHQPEVGALFFAEQSWKNHLQIRNHELA